MKLSFFLFEPRFFGVGLLEDNMRDWACKGRMRLTCGELGRLKLHELAYLLASLAKCGHTTNYMSWLEIHELAKCMAGYLAAFSEKS
jgi:hypothetical protein